MSIQYSDLQKKCAQFIANYALAGQSCILGGDAGTGKTELLKLIKKNLERRGRYVYATATTNPASGQLSGKLDEECTTIHSFLDLYMFRDNYEGGYVLKRKHKRKILKGRPKDRVIIVDEYSMVDDKTFKFIVEDMQRHTYIFVGDIEQLPPVNTETNDEHVTLIEALNLPKIILSVNYRQLAGNDNVPLSKDLRLLNDNDGRCYQWINRDEVYEYMANEDARYIAWRNEVVNTVNEGFREYMGYTQPYVEGEEIIMQAPYSRYYNGERIEIKKREITTLTHGGFHPYNCFRLNDDIYIPINAAEWARYRSDVRLLKNKAKQHNRRHEWDDYYTLLERFASVKYGYAITTHKSQGMTMDKVICDLPDILSCRSKFVLLKLFYVMLSRGKYNYFIRR